MTYTGEKEAVISAPKIEQETSKPVERNTTEQNVFLDIQSNQMKMLEMFRKLEQRMDNLERHENNNFRQNSFSQSWR